MSAFSEFLLGNEKAKASACWGGARARDGVNSHHTMRSLQVFCGGMGFTPPPTVAALLGISLPALTPDRVQVKEPYFAVLGNIEPRKNHWMLLQLWRPAGRALWRGRTTVGSDRTARLGV